MLLVYFIAAIYFLETVLRIAVSGKIITTGVIYALLFAVPLGVICYLICSFFKPQKQRNVARVIVTIIATVFVSQFIYFKIFRMFYSLYSAANAGQVFQFWEIIYIKVRNNFPIVVLMYLPLFISFINTKRIKAKLESQAENLINNKKRYRLKLAGMAVVVQTLTIATLFLGNKAQYTPYDLYFKHMYPIISAEKLGLVTTLRLEAKRSLFDWAPGLDDAGNESVTINQLSDEEFQADTAIEAMSYDVESNETKDENVDYNVLNIDFDKLINEADSDEMKEMNTYFKNVVPTEKNEYTGKYKGYNLICITAESFSPYAIREDLTPTLYKLAHEGYQFTNFYTPLWELSTSDGEYALCTGQIPKSGVWSMSASANNEMPYTLGNQLRNVGYNTRAYHDHDYDYYDRNLSHPNLGYDYKAEGLGLPEQDMWPESDVAMMEETTQDYVSDEPFHTYYMTVSGHMNYTFRENAMAEKNRAYVEDLDLSERAKGYLACQIELDRAVQYLLEQLEEAGTLDNTLIMITPDHYPYGLDNSELSELAGEQVDETFGLYKSTLILYNPNMTPVTIDKPCSSLDVLPTLSNLMGLGYDSRLFVGKDIFSDSEPLVLLYSRSFITDKGMYNAITREFSAFPGVEVDEDYVKEKIKEVDAKFYYSAKVLEEDYYKIVEDARN